MVSVNVFHSPEISRLMTTPVLLEQIETIQQNAVHDLNTHDQGGSTFFFLKTRV